MLRRESPPRCPTLHHGLACTRPVVCALPESPRCPPSPPEWDPGRQRPHDAAPTAEGGGCRAWQTVWFPSESPVTQNDFNREQVCPAGPGVGVGAGPPREGPAATLTCSGPRPPTTSRPARPPGLQLRGSPCSRPPRGPSPLGDAAGLGCRAAGPAPPAGPSVDGVSSMAYDILPGCRLPGPCPPAFCMSRSPLLASWVGSCKEVGGGGGGRWAPGRGGGRGNCTHLPSAACTLGPAAYGVEDCYNSHFPSAHGGGHPRLAETQVPRHWPLLRALEPSGCSWPTQLARESLAFRAWGPSRASLWNSVPPAWPSDPLGTRDPLSGPANPSDLWTQPGAQPGALAWSPTCPPPLLYRDAVGSSEFCSVLGGLAW